MIIAACFAYAKVPTFNGKRQMRGNHAYVVTSAVNAMLNLSIVVNKRWGSVIFSITNSSCTQHENMFSYKPGYNKIKQWLLPLTDFVIKSYFVSDPRTSDPDCNFRAVQYEKYGSSRITPTLLCNKAIHYRYIFHCSSLIYSRLICKRREEAVFHLIASHRAIAENFVQRPRSS